MFQTAARDVAGHLFRPRGAKMRYAQDKRALLSARLQAGAKLRCFAVSGALPFRDRTRHGGRPRFLQ